MHAPSLGRRFLIVLLALASALAACAAVAASHLERQLLDEDQWVQTTTRALEAPVVRTTLARTLVDRVYVIVDARRGAGAVPGRLYHGIKSAAFVATERALASGEFTQQWAAVHREGHRQLMLVLRDESDYATSSERTVTVHVDALLEEAGRQIGLRGIDISNLPGVRTSVSLPNTERVARGLTLLRWVDGAARPLAIASALLLGLALVLATRWRLWTLTVWGIGAVGVLLALRNAVREIGERVPATLTPEPEWQQPLTVIYDLTMDPLLERTTQLIWWSGALAAVAAVLVMINAIRAR